MDQEKINALGDELYEALCGAYAVLPLTDREPDIQIEDAYQISLRLLQRRMEDRGETIVGKKIGVTSQPVQEMLQGTPLYPPCSAASPQQRSPCSIAPAA